MSFSLSTSIDKEELDQNYRQTRLLLKNYPDSAIVGFQNIAKIANENQWVDLEAKALKDMGTAHKVLTEYNDAIDFYRQSLTIYKQLKDSVGMAAIFNNLGNVYRNLAQFDKSLDYYLRSISIDERIGESVGLGYSYNNLGNFLSQRKMYEESIEYYLKAISIFERFDERWGVANTNMNIGASTLDQGAVDSSFKYLQKAHTIAEDLDDQQLLAALNANFGKYYEYKSQYHLATQHLMHSKELYENVGDDYGLMKTYRDLATLSIKRQDLSHAIEELKVSIALADQIEAPTEKLESLIILADAYQQKGNYQQASYTLSKYTDLKDSVDFQLSDLRAKYEREKREKDLALKNIELEKQTAQKRFYLGAFFFVVILMGVLIAFSRHRQKTMAQLREKDQELYHKKVNELIKDQEIKSMESMIKGEEKERKRVAVDLHDRLGNTLSAVKLHFNAIKENLNGVSEEIHEQYDKTEKILDEAVTDVREIAHNMLSGVLMQSGLVAALNNLKTTIVGANQIEMKVLTYGLDKRLDTKIELNIYRIIQELVSNTIKHASASEIVVQLNRHNDELIITVEDNGLGFDPKIASDKGGIGLKNISSRVQVIHGHMEIDSGRGSGTTVSISLPV